MSHQEPRASASSRRVVSNADATALIDDVVVAIELLDDILGEETTLLKAGRVTQALDLAPVKADRSGHYLRLLEAVKANTIALARYAPDDIRLLRDRHRIFAQSLALNETVLATVKSVSEGIMRSLTAEAIAPMRATTYGPGLNPHLAHKPQSPGPMSLSIKL